MNPFNIKKTVKITSKSSGKLNKLRSDNKNIKKPTTNFLFYFLVLKPVRFLYTFKIRKLHYEKKTTFINVPGFLLLYQPTSIVPDPRQR